MNALVEGMLKLDQGWAPTIRGGSVTELDRASVLTDIPSLTV